MHAYGNSTLRRVFVTSGHEGVHERMLLPPMTIREATQLQVQLGVAIGEANGQMKMNLDSVSPE